MEEINNMNYAQVYIKTQTETQAKTRRETLQEEFDSILRQMREAYDIIAKDFNNYPKEVFNRLNALEDKHYKIYEEMKAEGEKTGYNELVKDFTEYCISKSRKP
jgi:alpha-amylase/alpha-mannosidase (GH57 family)